VEDNGASLPSISNYRLFARWNAALAWYDAGTFPV
jgi:hypothetical protein